jgi:hypothetical protein
VLQLHDPVHRGEDPRERQKSRSLSLSRTTSGWALLDDDRTVFEDHGTNSRRRCIAYACTVGVLHLRFDG